MSTSIYRRASAWLVTIGLMLGGTAIATANDGPSSKSARRESTGQIDAFGGRVIATKMVKLRGTDQRNLVALIRDREGQRRLIDLGPRDKASRLQLAAGDQLFVRGTIARVKGKSLVIAKSASTGDGNRLIVDRSRQHQQFDRVVRRAHAKMCQPLEAG